MPDEQNAQDSSSTSENRVVRVNYPANSNKAKAQANSSDTPNKESKKKIERVTTGEVQQRKKGLGRKIAETFTGDDIHNVGNYVLFDVILPAVKSMVSDAVSQGVERTLFGESSRRSNRSTMGSRSTTYTNYNNYSRNSVTGRAGESDTPRTLSSRSRAAHDFNDIVIDDRGQAEEVLDRLNDLIKSYDVATVSDLYDLVGITSTFTDEKWGWFDMKDSGVRRVSGGYLLLLPPTRPID